MNTDFTPNTNGIWFNLPEKTYREAPGENISTAKAALKSPAHYLAEKQQPKETTPAMLLGTCIHTAVLQPHLLAGSYVVRPDGMTFVTKEGKAWRDSQTAPILTIEDHVTVSECAKSVRQHPQVAEILKAAKVEVSVFQTHEETGLLRKGRLDIITTDKENRTTIADIKTCDDASPEGFARSIGKYLYAPQAAFYTDLIGAEYFLFICVEKAPPYACAVYCLDAASIAAGRDQYEACLRKIALGYKTGKWPAYSEGIEMISMPRWAALKEAA